jgi:hypothetical protein
MTASSRPSSRRSAFRAIDIRQSSRTLLANLASGRKDRDQARVTQSIEHADSVSLRVPIVAPARRPDPGASIQQP